MDNQQQQHLETIIDELTTRIGQVTLESASAKSVAKIWQQRAEELQKQVDELTAQLQERDARSDERVEPYVITSMEE